MPHDDVSVLLILTADQTNSVGTFQVCLHDMYLVPCKIWKCRLTATTGPETEGPIGVSPFLLLSVAVHRVSSGVVSEDCSRQLVDV